MSNTTDTTFFWLTSVDSTGIRTVFIYHVNGSSVDVCTERYIELADGEFDYLSVDNELTLSKSAARVHYRKQLSLGFAA